MAQFWSRKRNSSATLSDEEVSPRGFSACGSDIVPPCAAKQNKAKFVEGRKSFSLSSIKSSQGRGNFFDDVVYEELIKLGFASLLSLFFPSANDSIRANEPSESVRHFCLPPSGWETFVFTQRCRPSKKLLTKFFYFYDSSEQQLAWFCRSELCQRLQIEWNPFNARMEAEQSTDS